jgi:hypothetical protein
MSRYRSKHEAATQQLTNLASTDPGALLATLEAEMTKAQFDALIESLIAGLETDLRTAGTDSIAEADGLDDLPDTIAAER